MGQLTQEFVETIERHGVAGHRYSLTSWELLQLARAWLELRKTRAQSSLADALREAHTVVLITSGPDQYLTDEQRLTLAHAIDGRGYGINAALGEEGK